MAGIIIATASYDRSIRLWDAASTRCTRMIAPPKEAKNESVRLHFPSIQKKRDLFFEGLPIEVVWFEEILPLKTARKEINDWLTQKIFETRFLTLHRSISTRWSSLQMENTWQQQETPISSSTMQEE